MKRLLLALVMILTLAGASMAQTTPAKNQDKKQEKKEVPAGKSGNVHLKKDGTPDKRYKENKVHADSVVHKKKDGTPDMRYKENKKKKKS